MIIKLDHRQQETAEAIQRIQKPAYEVEAKLIGFDGIPQLKESVEDIQRSDEIFWGMVEERLKGFISFKEIGKTIDIHRLVVDPAAFRQGIGKTLLVHLMEQYGDHDFLVSTGTANEPAVNLYKSFGFAEQKRFEAATGIVLSEFLKRK